MSKPTNKKKRSKTRNEGNLQETSTELTGGAGFTYEDKVVAYYLAALLRAEKAMLQDGIVCSVAVQQAGHGHPMDDLVVEFSDFDGLRTLGLQVKTSIVISASPSSKNFRDVLNRAKRTLETEDFHVDRDAFGYVVENVAEVGHRSFQRITNWAKSSPSSSDFHARFLEGGAAARGERDLFNKVSEVIAASSLEDQWNFYRHFVGARFNGLDENGLIWTEVTNRLQELVASNEDGIETLLFDRLCRIVRDGAGTARKWTRASLISQLHGVVRLNVSARLLNDIRTLTQFSTDCLYEISEHIDGFQVDRIGSLQSIQNQLNVSRVVNISGLPGCGKSVVLKRFAAQGLNSGPIIFLKSDRLAGKSWLEFAGLLGIKNRNIDDVLVEIGAAGTSVIFIDGIDRINPDQRRIIIDILSSIEGNPELSNWKVLASSRALGLESYRAWFPESFYKGTNIGDVQINAFNDVEAESLAKEKPELRPLLMGNQSVREIARRPFFASVLAKNFGVGGSTPQTEVDLINAWWSRAGYDATTNVIPQRQRALLDIAEKGVANLGKNVPARSLASPTFEYIAALKSDLLVRGHNGDASYSFSHDIFFEWTFFRLLIDLGDKWIQGLVQSGEPPLLGRVVNLLAQHTMSDPGKWIRGYAELDQSTLRPQWRREWLTAPPFSTHFKNFEIEFTNFVTANDHALFENLLVWFQAQHTIPNPVVLSNASQVLGSTDPITLAELFSWPGDFESWGRLLDWLFPLAPNIPGFLLPKVVEIFSVWQNVNLGVATFRSNVIVRLCADWLIEVEQNLYTEKCINKSDRWHMGHAALKAFSTALRVIILRSVKVFPEHSNNLFDRAIANHIMGKQIYSELMSFSGMMAEVSPELLAALAKSQLKMELPKEKVERQSRELKEKNDRIQIIRDKSPSERNEKEKKVLSNVSLHLSYGNGEITRDHVGINSHHDFYYPISSIYEPFYSLFSSAPEIGIELVKDLSNHATTAWRQVADVNPRSTGTPIAIMIQFPWGVQQFWGNWQCFNWQFGHLSQIPLECAFLALSRWAFLEIDKGRPVDEVIQLILKENSCIAALGIVLRLALDRFHLSETTFALVTCQRLWTHDISRLLNQLIPDQNLFGQDPKIRQTAASIAAGEFLHNRLSTYRDIRDLAAQFLINGSDDFKARLKHSLSNFVTSLPFEIEEQIGNQDDEMKLVELANEYAALALQENYQKILVSDEQHVFSFSPALSSEEINRRDRTAISLQQSNILAWAITSLRNSTLKPDMLLEDAVQVACPLDHKSLFEERMDVENHNPQSMVAAVAACVICFGKVDSAEYQWSLDVMTRIEVMKEPSGAYEDSVIPWHPVLQIIFALRHLRHINSSDFKSARRLVMLTLHSNKRVANMALDVLLQDPNIHVSWFSAQLALDYAIYYAPNINENGRPDNRIAKNMAISAQYRCIERLNSESCSAFNSLPPAWIQKINYECNEEFDDQESTWAHPNFLFNPRCLEDHIHNFQFEKWCASDILKPLVYKLVLSLVNWTEFRIQRPGEKIRGGNRSTVLIVWNEKLGDVLARVAVNFEYSVVEKDFLGPFFNSHRDERMQVIAAFVDFLIRRHLLDSKHIPNITLELLDRFVELVINDEAFELNGFFAGEISGPDIPKIINSIFFVNIDVAPDAARFVNGNWSEIDLIMPRITRLLNAAGWSAFVMSNFLSMCERAGASYPLDNFIQQVSKIISMLDNAKGSWSGTRLVSRTSAVIQKLADANYPLKCDQANGLLRILDSLIDLGDRRSAALEQTEAFKGIQARAPLS